MHTIGLLGGMSWESTLEYYRLLNQGVQRRLGGIHSAQLLVYSVDFAPIAAAQHRGDWEEATALLVDAARRLERGGADFGLLCTNTMHKVLPEIERGSGLPFIHIADATAMAIRSAGHGRVGLLGTRFTMEQDFYHQRLEAREIETLVPGDADRYLVHRVIYDELCRGVISPESRESFAQVIERLVRRGAEGVVLGCTEIPLLIQQEHSPVPVFDTMRIHIEAALDQALEGIYA